jgi:hypothetical protein
LVNSVEYENSGEIKYEEEKFKFRDQKVQNKSEEGSSSSEEEVKVSPGKRSKKPESLD